MKERTESLKVIQNKSKEKMMLEKYINRATRVT